MYLVQKNQFIATRPRDADFEELVNEIFLPGNYEFVIFDERTREKGLIAKADPAKLRILYNEETQEDDMTSGGIITIFQRATKKGLAKLKRFPDPYIYVSRLGFCRSGHGWIDSPSMKMFAELADQKNLLFYGKIHGHRDGIMNMLAARGLKIKHVKVDLGREKLAETMIKNQCFAVLGIDGASIGCWRDWETALAGVPCLRVTESPEFDFAINPVGHYLTTSFAEDLNKKVEELARSVQDGTILPRLQAAKQKALVITSDPEFYEAMDSVACDWNFLLARATPEAKRNLVSEFVEKGKGIKTINDPVPFEKLTLPNALLHDSKPMPGKVYWGTHTEWQDVVIFEDSRTFRRKFFTETEGTWTFDGSILTLNWFKWDAETAVLNSKGEFVSSLFKLKPFDVEEKTVRISKLEGVITCKNYSDYLSATLPLNKKHFDKLIVVTTKEDKETQEICKANSVEFVFSDRFLLNGPFNMGAATNDGFKALSKTDWVLRFDADIILPDDFGQAIRKMPLNDQCFYGTSRIICETEQQYEAYLQNNQIAKHEKEFAGSGYFQLFKSSAWVLKGRPEWYSNSFPSAGGVDLEFRDLWKSYGLLRYLTNPVVHLGKTGVNWGGRKTGGKWVAPKPRVQIEGYVSALGDRLCSLAAARAYAKANPNKEVFFDDLPNVVKAYGDELLTIGKCPDKIQAFPIKRQRQKGGSADINYLGTYLSEAGIRVAQDNPPRLELPNANAVPDIASPYCVLQPYSTYAKNPSKEFVQRLVDIVKDKYKVIACGSESTPKDLQHVDYSFLSNDAMQMLQLICHATLVMSPRSASAHIAAAYSVPSFIWVPDDGENWHLDYPDWKIHKVSTGDPQYAETELLIFLGNR